MQSSDLGGDEVLTDLCAICHVNPIKYTCPRCSIHTCSLPCVKKHKKWAQCSGVRDPAEYRKRADLGTAASIDKDFNFITKVERSIQRADDNVVNRGINLRPARSRFVNSNARSKLEQEYEHRHISIIKAPSALSRNKCNKTHWASPAKCIYWTIEWVFPDGQKRIGGAHESKTIEEAHIAVSGRKAFLKRKRAAEDIEELPTTRDDAAGAPQLRQIGTANIATEQDPISPDTTDGHVQQLNYYLHRPNTEARHKVLIPIQADQLLSDVVNNKTFLEFPTISVRYDSALELKAPFIMEEEYLKQHGHEIPVNITAQVPTTVPEPELEEGELLGKEANQMANVKELQVLEMIAKDLGD